MDILGGEKSCEGTWLELDHNLRLERTFGTSKEKIQLEIRREEKLRVLFEIQEAVYRSSTFSRTFMPENYLEMGTS
jgi:hypothetical protein